MIIDHTYCDVQGVIIKNANLLCKNYMTAVGQVEKNLNSAINTIEI